MKLAWITFLPRHHGTPRRLFDEVVKPLTVDAMRSPARAEVGRLL